MKNRFALHGYAPLPDTAYVHGAPVALFDGPATDRHVAQGPALAIVGAIGSGAAGFGMLTAAGASVGTMLAGGAMLAGSALSVVGTITKNPKLQKFGGILSLAGGVGGLMSGGWEAIGSKVAESASMGTSQIGASQMGPQAIEAAAGGAPSSLTGGMEGITSAGQVQDAATGVMSQVSSPRGLISESMKPAPIVNTTGAPGIMDRVSGMGKWVKDNKELVNVGGGLLSGAMQQDERQQLYEQQRRYQNEDRARLNESVQGAADVPFTINPGAKPFNTPPLDPTRFRTPAIPQRKVGG